MKQAILFALLFCGSVTAGATSASDAPMMAVDIDLADKPALQRGAKWFMNYCFGCHALRYQRYNRMAKDIGLVDDSGQVDEALLRENLMFTDANPGDLIENAMPAQDARQWFGIAPPDLTLVTRVRGTEWVYNYLLNFYRADDRPWGSNNWVFPDVGMPNILADLQGEQVPAYRSRLVKRNGGSQEIAVIDHLQLLTEGQMDHRQFEQTIHDLVNFLAYTAEPMKLKQHRLGFWVIGFLIIFLIVAYLMKRQFWRDLN